MSLVTDLVKHYQQAIERRELSRDGVPSPTRIATEWQVSRPVASRARKILIEGSLNHEIKSLSEITERDWGRFLSKVDPPNQNGCTLWTGATSKGYGSFWFGGEMRPAYIVAYTYQIGPVPRGLQLDHVWARGCRSTLCVNVAHLEPVTQAENTRRWHAARRWMAGIQVWTELDDNP